MAPHHRRSDSSEDEGSDAPEALSLSQSKKHIQKLETTRKNAEIAQRQSKREKNRERDRKLKERAEKNKDEAAVKISAKGKGKAVVESQNRDDELQARMERAMQEAQEESSEDEGPEDKAESSSQFEELKGVSVNDEDEEDENSSIEDEDAEEEDDNESESEDEDESEDDAVHEEPPKSQKTRFNPDHLPDELFTAAFASKPKRKTLAENSEKDTDTTISRPAKKRKSSKIQKDVVIGSRAIRLLPNSNQPSVPATLPSRKVKRFIDRTLALKGGKQRTKGWERRSVNIGVLRRDGPPVHFVRNA